MGPVPAAVLRACFDQTAIDPIADPYGLLFGKPPPRTRNRGISFAYNCMLDAKARQGILKCLTDTFDRFHKVEERLWKELQK